MRSRRFFTIVLPVAFVAGLGASAVNDAHGEFALRGGHVETPESSIELPEHHGIRAHTNYKMFVPNAGSMASPQKSSLEEPALAGGPPYAGYFYETPASLGCVYQLVSPGAEGRNPNTVTANPTGGGGAIAIVGAYHYPTAASDLSVFSNQFGLPQANFQVVYANNLQPPVDANWNIEEALDIQWAHAMAPSAKIYLVEAASNNFRDLLPAVSLASSLVSSAGGGEVSISWGGSEFSGESSYDSYFTRSGVVYFAASGDSPGVMWPSTSPNVVSVGGTSLSRNPTTGNFQQEMAWQSGGGGPSVYEPRPGYQNVISATVGNQRGTPDVAADADPSTGVWVYAYPYWSIVGGSSVAAPVWAGIVNAAGSFSSSSLAELNTIYSNPGTADITAGSCGPNQGYMVKGGWDFCTGLGSPLGEGGK